jgi:hypothetical protein
MLLGIYSSSKTGVRTKILRTMSDNDNVTSPLSNAIENDNSDASTDIDRKIDEILNKPLDNKVLDTNSDDSSSSESTKGKFLSQFSNTYLLLVDTHSILLVILFNFVKVLTLLITKTVMKIQTTNYR